MYKFLILPFCWLFLNGNVYGQEIEHLQTLIDSLVLEREYEELVQISSRQKRLVDLQHFEIVYAVHGVHEDSIIRILAFESIRKIQYFLYEDDLFDKARDLYIDATKKLILEYANDIDSLKKIEVTPSVRLLIWPELKNAIENAGGEWDKGEIPNVPVGGVPIRGNLIPED